MKSYWKSNSLENSSEKIYFFAEFQFYRHRLACIWLKTIFLWFLSRAELTLCISMLHNICINMLWSLENNFFETKFSNFLCLVFRFHQIFYEDWHFLLYFWPGSLINNNIQQYNVCLKLTEWAKHVEQKYFSWWQICNPNCCCRKEAAYSQQILVQIGIVGIRKTTW